MSFLPRLLGLVCLGLAAVGLVSSDVVIDSMQLWKQQTIASQQVKFYRLPEMPPDIEWFRVSIVTSGSPKLIHMCLRFGAPPILPVSVEEGHYWYYQGHHCSHGLNYTVGTPHRNEDGRYYAMVFTDLSRMGATQYIPSSDTLKFELMLVFPSPPQVQNRGGKDNKIEVGEVVEVPYSYMTGDVYHGCVTLPEHLSLVVFRVQYGAGAQSEPSAPEQNKFQLRVAPAGETMDSTAHRVPSSQEGASFSYIHPPEGRWCMGIFADAALSR